MLELTVRQRIAALVLFILLGVGGILVFISRNSRYADTYANVTAPAKIYVHVCGAVAKPGVVCLEPATRKFDALKQVGGTLPDADLNRVNLAEFALDGEQIYVPKIGEVLKNLKTRKTVPHKKSTPKTTPLQSMVSKNIVQWPLDVNTATTEQLEKVSGIGPGLAAKIVQYRTQNGLFQNYDDLMKVAGIGQAKLEKFKPFLAVK